MLFLLIACAQPEVPLTIDITDQWWEVEEGVLPVDVLVCIILNTEGDMDFETEEGDSNLYLYEWEGIGPDEIRVHHWGRAIFMEENTGFLTEVHPLIGLKKELHLTPCEWI